MTTTTTASLSEIVDGLFEPYSGAVARDLKLNLKRVMEGGALTPEEAHLALLGVASALDMPVLARYAAASLEQLGLLPDEIEEGRQSAAMMAMLNTYYKFRHMTDHAGDYQAAGLRMTVFAKPLLGKVRFEMLAFTISVLNGCESCIRSHEEFLRQSAVSVEKIHDLVRLAAIGSGIRRLGSM